MVNLGEVYTEELENILKTCLHTVQTCKVNEDVKKVEYFFKCYLKKVCNSVQRIKILKTGLAPK